MDELHEYCARMLGDRDAAARVANDARRSGGPERLRELDYAVRACRIAGENRPRPEVPAPAGRQLATAVSAELSRAAASLPQREQEALALRELLRLSHYGNCGGDRDQAVRGGSPSGRLPAAPARRATGTGHGHRRMPRARATLRTVTVRQDSEPVPAADDDWLIEHLGHCAGCGRAHAALHEGSVRYRGWRPAT